MIKCDIRGTLGKFGYGHVPDEIADKILQAVTDQAHYTAVKRAPYDPEPDGIHLREHVKKDIDLSKKVGYVFIETNEIPYALVAEYGSRNRLAHPYMKPAANAARQKIKAIVRIAAKEAIAEEKLKSGGT